MAGSARGRGGAGDTGGVDVRERGAAGQALDRRLYLQLQAWGGCADPKPLAEALAAARLEAVLYADLHDPRGIAVAVMTEDAATLAGVVRDVLGASPFAALVPRPALAMLGRSYASGFESDLEDWLLRRPRRTVLNPAWPWAIWYPLRRAGSFARLPAEEQAAILREHGAIGRAYAEADLAHDVRLACHGLDPADNDFVIGLVGRELHPLSHLVQTMRRTVQTSTYLERLGPFFVGRVLWQAPAPGDARPATP